MAVRVAIVSPEPRATSFAKASRFWATKASRDSWSSIESQFCVPLVMANVCPPLVFVDAAVTWRRPGLVPKMIDPSPHPAAP